MKASVVISLELPTAEDVVEVLLQIDPPSIPFFARQVRIVVGRDVDDLNAWLDENVVS